MFKMEEIRLIVYDFDGVMTDNSVILSEDGKESVIVNRGDGLAISEIKKIGIEQIILSTEKNPVVVRRAEKLKIPVIHGTDNKAIALEQYCQDNKLDIKRVMYVGNDINDYEVMTKVGIRVCPNDAEQEVKDISDIIIKRNGGKGVIRELLNVILKL